MKAIQIERFGGPDVLRLVDLRLLGGGLGPLPQGLSSEEGGLSHQRGCGPRT